MPQQLQLTVQPRLQAETWSLYWKETTKTSTDCLKSVEMSFDAEGATVANLMDQVAAHVGWAPEDGLTRLPGFTGPWQRALCKGRELQASHTLQQAGLADGAVVTVVRIELIAEGWKVQDELDLSSDSDDE